VAPAAPPEQLAICDGWETVDAEWIAPAEALRLAEAKQRTVIFPTRMNLQLLAEAEGAEDAVLRARARGWRVVEVAVNWEDQPASKVGVFTDGPRMLWQMLAARWRVAREERRR